MEQHSDTRIPIEDFLDFDRAVVGHPNNSIRWAACLEALAEARRLRPQYTWPRYPTIALTCRAPGQIDDHLRYKEALIQCGPNAICSFE